MKARIGQHKYTIIPDGKYRVKVISIVEVYWTYIKAQAWLWTFEIMNGVNAGCRISGHTNLHSSFGPKQKVGRWYHAITGAWLNGGDEIDTDYLLNKTSFAQIRVVFDKDKKPANKIELISKEAQE